MALNLHGRGGTLRHGTRIAARLSSWRKQAARVTFEVDYVNAFVAGLGDPTHVAIPVSSRVTRVYPIVSGTLDDGAVKVDLMRATSERTEEGITA